MTADELRVVIEAHLLGGPTYAQMTEFASRVATAAPEVYDTVIAGMRADGVLD
jgi:hypothetical protein